MGEATLTELWDDFCRQKDFEDPLLVPAKKGVYCIRIPAGMEVTFKDTIDNHPGAAYPIERLEAKRIPSSGILYIGKANGKRGLFQRLRQYMRYGFDGGNNHRGGRAIFQVEGYENLIRNAEQEAAETVDNNGDIPGQIAMIGFFHPLTFHSRIRCL